MQPIRTSKLLYVGLLIALAACQATPPVATAVPTAIPSAVAATVPPAQALITFAPKSFGLPISFDYGSVWKVEEEYSDVVILRYAVPNHDAGLSVIAVKDAQIGGASAGTFPADFVSWITSPASLFRVTDSKPVVVGGYQGTQINAVAACGSATMWISVAATGWKCPNGEPIGFIYLADVFGAGVLIQIQGSPSGEDYALIVEESQKVLDTVAFSQPVAAGDAAGALKLFSPKTFKLAVSLKLGSGWSVLDDGPDVLTLVTTSNYVDTAFIIVKDTYIVGPQAPFARVAFPVDFVTWIQAHGYFQVTGFSPVVIGGLPGTQITANATAECGKKTNWLFLQNTGWNCRQGEYYRFIDLKDVNGQHVLIMNTGGDDLSAAHFKAGTDASQVVLDTVSFP
jgi:hypothetical protein